MELDTRPLNPIRSYSRDPAASGPRRSAASRSCVCISRQWVDFSLPIKIGTYLAAFPKPRAPSGEAGLSIQNEKYTHFQKYILKFPQMGDLIFRQNNRLIARGSQLIAFRDMLN